MAFETSLEPILLECRLFTKRRKRRSELRLGRRQPDERQDGDKWQEADPWHGIHVRGVGEECFFAAGTDEGSAGTSTSFRREVVPDRTLTSECLHPRCSASTSHSRSLALPSTAAARTRTTHTPSGRSSTPSLLEPGLAWTQIRGMGWRELSCDDGACRRPTEGPRAGPSPYPPRSCRGLSRHATRGR